jgi:hypothetical protein
VNADSLEKFLSSSAEYQRQVIKQQRETDRLQAKMAELEQKHSAQLQQRWLRVPKWRRAIILAAQWVQFKFTPRWL